MKTKEEVSKTAQKGLLRNFFDVKRGDGNRGAFPGMWICVPSEKSEGKGKVGGRTQLDQFRN